MTSPVNSFQDILDAFDQDHSLRDQLRRHILTEEILQLPAQFLLLRSDVEELRASVEQLVGRVDQLAEGQQRLESTVGQLAEGQQRLESTVGQLAEGQQRLESTVSQLSEGQQRLESTVSQLSEGQQRLESTTASMGGTLSRLDGTSYEDHAVDLAPRIIRNQFNLSQLRIVARRGQRDELRDIALAATGNDLISDTEANQLQNADLIVAGQDQGGSTVYVLAEISITVQQPDIDRAAGRALILESATGITTVPVAIGSEIQDSLQSRNVRLVTIPTQEELDAQYHPSAA